MHNKSYLQESQENKMLNRITSSNTALWLVLAAVVVLFPNFFYVMYNIGGDMPIPGLRITQSFLGGVFVSGSIAYFTLRKNYKVAYAFAIFEMLISFFYYWNRLMFDSAGDFQMNFQIIPASIIAMFLPWALKFYASTAGESEQPTRITDSEIESTLKAVSFINRSENDRNQSLAKAIKEKYKGRIEKLEQENKAVSDSFNEVYNELEELKNTLVHPDTFGSLEKQKEHLEMYNTEIEDLKKSNAKIVFELNTTVELLEKEVQALQETKEDNDRELIKAGMQIDVLEKEKEWYRSLVTDKDSKKKNLVSPIFESPEHITEEPERNQEPNLNDSKDDIRRR